MWPFSAWLEALARARIRAAFGRYVSPDIIDKIENDPGLLKPFAPEKRRVFFALLQIRDDDHADLPGRLRHAVEITGKGGGLLDIMPPLVLINYGYPLNDTADAWRRERGQVLEQLLRDCGSELRIVFGEADGLVGNLGSDQRFYYGAAIPGFSGALQKLLALEFGTAAEVHLA